MARKKVKNAPTPEQVDFFYTRLEHYQKLLNLLDWRVERGGLASKGNIADVDLSLEDKLATVRLGDNWENTKIDEKSIDQAAAHEMVHIFLYSLIEASKSRDPAAIATAEHSVVVILERILSGNI